MANTGMLDKVIRPSFRNIVQWKLSGNLCRLDLVLLIGSWMISLVDLVNQTGIWYRLNRSFNWTFLKWDSASIPNRKLFKDLFMIQPAVAASLSHTGLPSPSGSMLWIIFVTSFWLLLCMGVFHFHLLLLVSSAPVITYHLYVLHTPEVLTANLLCLLLLPLCWARLFRGMHCTIANHHLPVFLLLFSDGWAPPSFRWRSQKPRVQAGKRGQ